MQRHAHGIESGRFDEVDVRFGDIDVAKLRPESGGVLRTDQPSNDSVDFRGGARPGKLEHIAFRHEPVAEVCSFDGEAFTVAADKMFPVGSNEVA